MPPTRAGRNATATHRAASVPVGRPENSRLESVRLKRPTLPVSDDGDPPPASLPDIVTARGRKHTCSSFFSRDCMANTSASTTAPTLDANEQCPQKRRKRSSSTSAPATSHATRLQTRRRSRSRARSPATDVESLPSRRSTRIARKFHSFINTRNSDIYTHLAGPDGAGSLLGEPPASSVVLPTPNGVGSQLVHRPRGRRKAVDLTNESAKKDLMEEWARMRQSQGTLPSARKDENASFNQVHPHDTRNGNGSLHLGSITQERSPEAHTLQTQRTIPDDFRRGSSLNCTDFENTFPLGGDGKKVDHTNLTLSSGDRTGQPVTVGVDVEVSSLTPNLHVDQGFPDGDIACAPETHNPDLQHYPASPFPVSRLEGDSDLKKLPILSEQTAAVNPDNPSKGNHSITVSSTRSIEESSICLDSDEEFYMLDIPEIFTLPWEPVSSQLYVPPSLGKLVSGMREQLIIEARARRRAEELYQAELSRRISAEKTIDDLRVELEQKDEKTYQQELTGQQQDGGG